MPTKKKAEPAKKATGPKSVVKDVTAPPLLVTVKGHKYGLDVETEEGKPSVKCDFVAGAPKHYDLGDGYLMMSGELQLANGQTAYAVLEISLEDGGEHCGTGFMIPAYDGQPQAIVFQGESNFLPQMRRFGLSSKDIFPYRYNYHEHLERDHHVGDDGWSL